LSPDKPADDVPNNLNKLEPGPAAVSVISFNEFPHEDVKALAKKNKKKAREPLIGEF
jgi:hypothetical protein